MKYSGIDLHSNNCLVTVTDGQEQVVVEKRVAKQEISGSPSGLPLISCSAAAVSVNPIGHVVAPRFFWGGFPPGRRWRHRHSLDPDGCLARFVASQDEKKR
ncbi:MAG: hypothetical protein LBU11_00360, partial [Zoogloeaceae bacterium]|nr:hypothetical protein [Zoogloeaceae bacterium]